MRLTRFIALMSFLLLPLLAGCGGGGGGSQAVGTRTVTVSISQPATKAKIPGSAAKPTRVAISNIQSVVVEVFDGTTRVAHTAQSFGTPISFQLPAKDLTFYAYGYAEATAPNYITDPKTGFLTDPNNNQPIVFGTTTYDPAHPHPIAQATTTISATASNIQFTINNAIAVLEPMDKDTNTKSMTVLTYDPATATQPIDLSTHIRARAADGSIVLLPTSVLNWTLGSTPNSAGTAGDPNTAVESQRAALTANGLMTVKATGPVHVTVTDNEINTQALLGGPYTQRPISATITFVIEPIGSTTFAVTPTPLPRYAKSVTYTLAQQPLVGENLTQVLDNPPMQVVQTFPVTLTFNAGNTSIVGASVTPVLTFVPTGRVILLTVQAWSGDNGTGALVAKGTIAATDPNANVQSSPPAQGSTLATYSATVPLTTNVTQFDLVAPGDSQPASPTLAIYNTSLNQLPLQLYARVGSTEVLLDPRTVGYTVTGGGSVVTTSVPAVYFDGSALLPSNPATPGLFANPVTVKAVDAGFGSLPTNTQANDGLRINVKRATPGYQFN